MKAIRMAFKPNDARESRSSCWIEEITEQFWKKKLDLNKIISLNLQNTTVKLQMLIIIRADLVLIKANLLILLKIPLRF